MIEAFSHELADWQPFYTTLAEVCATLAGLLFVALSLHASSLAGADKVNLRRLARHTFTDFILVLAVALALLCPHLNRSSVGVAVLAPGIVGLGHFARTLYDAMRERQSLHRGYLLRRLRLSSLGFVFLVACGASMLAAVSRNELDYWFLLFAALVLLLLAATRNAWFLLVHEFA